VPNETKKKLPQSARRFTQRTQNFVSVEKNPCVLCGRKRQKTKKRKKDEGKKGAKERAAP
jgi:hypothetical protein